MTPIAPAIIMKRQLKNSADIARDNNWKVGDVLVGDEGHGDEYVKITAIGERCILCRWSYKYPFKWREEDGSTSLQYREWKLWNT